MPKSKVKTSKPHNSLHLLQIMKKDNLVRMGPTESYSWRKDPRHLVFMLSRYKFCAKILAGKKKVLEIGCGDSFALPLVLQTVGSVHAIDFDPLIISWASGQQKKEKQHCSFAITDISKEIPSGGPFDATFALDFIEHVPKINEKKVMKNICRVLDKNAVCILGTPNAASAKFESKYSKKWHVNLKDHLSLRNLLSNYFSNVFIFSMNDEVVHTGFYPMAHYLFGIGVGLKKN